MGIEGEIPLAAIDADHAEYRPLVTPLFTPGDPSVDDTGNLETWDQAIGPWTDDSLTEFYDDGVDIHQGEQQAARDNPRLF